MVKTLTLIVPLLKRVLHTNKFTSLGALLALVAVVLLKLHDISSADFLVLIGSAVTVIGFASKDGVRADEVVAPENVTASPGVGPGALVALLLLALGVAGCSSQFPQHQPKLDAVTLALVASHPMPGATGSFAPAPAAVNPNDSLEAAPDSISLPPYLAAPPKGLTKRQVRQFRRAQRKALIEASRVVPGKVKVQRGSAYNTAPAGTAVALHKADAPVGVGTGTTTTDNRNVGRGANGGVTSAAHDAGPATGATVPPKPGLLARLWAGVQEYGLVALALAFFAGVAWLRFGPVGSGVRLAAAAARTARGLRPGPQVWPGPEQNEPTATS